MRPDQVLPVIGGSGHVEGEGRGTGDERYAAFVKELGHHDGHGVGNQ